MSGSSVVSRIAHDSFLHAPSIMPEGPWWDHLESNFYERPEGFELEPRDLIRVRATAALDVALRTTMAAFLAPLTVPVGYRPKALRQMLAERKLYEPVAESGDPSGFFKAPPECPDVQTSKPNFLAFKAEGGSCEDLRFESAYVPFNARIRKSYLSHEANRTVHGRYWKHQSGPRPTIIAVHGFGAEPYWINQWMFALPWFYRIGCDVLLVTLPFHGRRQGRGSMFSGHGFFSGGMSRVNEAFGQAVFDIRTFVSWLEREQGVDQIGVTGISLGGYTSALLAAVEPRLKFSIPNVPLVSLPDLVLEWEPIGSILRTAMLVTGTSIKSVRRALAVTSPLTYKPVIDRERLMIIGGVGDRLAPPKHSRLLWDHWGRCRIHWFPGSHIIHLDRGDYLRRMGRFLNEIGFNQDRRANKKSARAASARARAAKVPADLESARRARAARRAAD